MALLGSVALASAPGTAAAETRPAYGGVLRTGLLGEPVTIDPVHARSHAELTLVSLLFDTLYRVDGSRPDGSPRVVPHVAAALPEMSRNGRVARIAIRPGITFHDLRKLTATDVSRSLARLRKSQAGWILAPVKSTWVDGDTLVVRLVRRTPDLALLLTAPQTSITPRGRFKQRRPWWDRAVIGSGPFRLHRKSHKNRRLVFGAAANHFAGRPYIEELIFHWFERPEKEATDYEAGRSEMSLRGPVAFAGHKPAYRTGQVSGPATLLTYVGFGATDAHGAVTRDRSFRRALSLALDRNSFRGIGTGERVSPAIHPIPPALGGAPVPPAGRRAQIAPARTLLNAAARNLPILKPDRSGARQLELEILIDRSRPDDREIAEKIVAALFRLGLRARITALPAREFRDRVDRGQCDLHVGQLVTPVPRRDVAMAAAFARGKDDWAQATLAAGPLDAEAATRVFARRLPVIPLFHRAVRIHHRMNIHGLSARSTSMFSLDDLFLFGEAERNR